MRLIGWIVGGTLAVAIAFFAPAQTGPMWYSLLFAGIAVFLFLLFFLSRELPELPDANSRSMIVVILALTFLLSVGASLINYDLSVSQQSRMSDIRATVDEGVLRSEINKIMLDLLRRRYHEREPGDVESFAAIFSQHYDSLFVDGRYAGERWPQEDSAPIIQLDSLTQERVELVGQSRIVRGKQSRFQNINEQSGFMQMRAVLTTEGVRYEMEN